MWFGDFQQGGGRGGRGRGGYQPLNRKAQYQGQLKCYPVSYMGREDLNKGNKSKIASFCPGTSDRASPFC